MPTLPRPAALLVLLGTLVCVLAACDAGPALDPAPPGAPVPPAPPRTSDSAPRPAAPERDRPAPAVEEVTAAGDEPVANTAPLPAPPRTLPPPTAPAPSSQPTRLVEITWPYEPRRSSPAGYEPGILVAEWDFDRNNDGYLDDPLAFRRAFRGRVPANFTGIVALDWENQMTEWLKQPPSSADYARALRHLKELLLIAKDERPQAQIGYYGLPLHEYWRRDDGWLARSKGLVSVLRFADWIGPSIYHFYRTDVDVAKQKQQRFAIENVELALEVAEMAGGKPVYAWVHHRYAGSNPHVGQELVPARELKDNVRWILAATRDGRRADGIIFWAADEWYLKQGEIRVQGDPATTLRRTREDAMTAVRDAARERR